MRKLLAASIAAAAMIAGPAIAADMPLKALPYKAPPPPVYTWTGCYIGGHVGGGWVRDDETNVGTINGANFPFGTTRSNDGSGVIGGLQAGCNYQFAPVWLVGFEGDFTWANINATSDTFGLINPAVVNHVSDNYRWMSDITARLGFIAADSLLLYVKGGAAWFHDEGGSVTTNNATGVVTDVISGSGTRVGWLIGVGGEWRVAPNWSFKLEYNFMDFRQTTSSFVDFGATAPVLTGTTLLRDHDTQIQTVKVGFNYLFGGPVVARY